MFWESLFPTLDMSLGYLEAKFYYVHSTKVWNYILSIALMCGFRSFFLFHVSDLLSGAEHTTSHVLFLRHQSQLLSKHQGEKTKKSKEAIR